MNRLAVVTPTLGREGKECLEHPLLAFPELTSLRMWLGGKNRRLIYSVNVEALQGWHFSGTHGSRHLPNCANEPFLCSSLSLLTCNLTFLFIISTLKCLLTFSPSKSFSSSLNMGFPATRLSLPAFPPANGLNLGHTPTYFRNLRWHLLIRYAYASWCGMESPFNRTLNYMLLQWVLSPCPHAVQESKVCGLLSSQTSRRPFSSLSVLRLCPLPERLFPICSQSTLSSSFTAQLKSHVP